MNYRIGKDQLLEILQSWDSIIEGRGRIHLIACGGTALTLLGYKESTKDVDFMIPETKEYARLRQFLLNTGYRELSDWSWVRPDSGILFDLYPGKRVFTTELLDSPLRNGGHRKVAEWKKIYLGVLNPIDWIITKMFRGSSIDRDDCRILMKYENINSMKLARRYRETAQYDVNPERLLKNLDIVLDDLKNIRRNKKHGK